jgi:hypothetical protein
MAVRQPLFQVRRELDCGVAHRERAGDAVVHEVLVGRPAPPGERVPQEADADVRVVVPGADVACERVAAQEGVELLDRIVGEGIVSVLRREVRRHAGKARRVGRQLDQGDASPAALGHPDAIGQVFGDRIVQADLAPPHHVAQQERRKHLAVRADLEQRVAVDLTPAAALVTSVRDDAAAIAIDDAHDDANAVTLPVDAQGEVVLDRRVGGQFRCRLGHIDAAATFSSSACRTAI